MPRTPCQLPASLSHYHRTSELPHTRCIRSQSQLYLGLSNYCFPHWLSGINFQYPRNTYGHFQIPTLEKRQPEASGLVARTTDKSSGSGTVSPEVRLSAQSMPDFTALTRCSPEARTSSLLNLYIRSEQNGRALGQEGKGRRGMLSGIYTAGDKLA